MKLLASLLLATSAIVEEKRRRQLRTRPSSTKSSKWCMRTGGYACTRRLGERKIGSLPTIFSKIDSARPARAASGVEKHEAKVRGGRMWKEQLNQMLAFQLPSRPLGNYLRSGEEGKQGSGYIGDVFEAPVLLFLSSLAPRSSLLLFPGSSMRTRVRR